MQLIKGCQGKVLHGAAPPQTSSPGGFGTYSESLKASEGTTCVTCGAGGGYAYRMAHQWRAVGLDSRAGSAFDGRCRPASSLCRRSGSIEIRRSAHRGTVACDGRFVSAGLGAGWNFAPSVLA